MTTELEQAQSEILRLTEAMERACQWSAAWKRAAKSNRELFKIMDEATGKWREECFVERKWAKVWKRAAKKWRAACQDMDPRDDVPFPRLNFDRQVEIPGDSVTIQPGEFLEQPAIQNERERLERMRLEFEIQENIQNVKRILELEKENARLEIKA